MSATGRAKPVRGILVTGAGAEQSPGRAESGEQSLPHRQADGGPRFLDRRRRNAVVQEDHHRRRPRFRLRSTAQTADAPFRRALAAGRAPTDRTVPDGGSEAAGPPPQRSHEQPASQDSR